MIGGGKGNKGFPIVNLSDQNGIWITWEEHRRTRELSREFGVSLHELHFPGPYGLRVLVLSLRTLGILLKYRPRILIVQNPSVVLASWAGVLRHLFGYYLIIDRHSNFKLDKMGSGEIKFRGFHWLSRQSLRAADLTIVTNEPLLKLLEGWGGRGFVMPDRFPELPFARQSDLGSGRHVLYICSFDGDEPICQVMDAARLLGDDVTFHVTGNYSRAAVGLLEGKPANLRFTGFLPEAKYQSLLASVDVVLTLTTMPHTMQCGAYEAVAASRPLVFGPDESMVRYFNKGRIVTELDSESIAAALRIALNDSERLAAESCELHQERGAWWCDNLEKFMTRVIREST